MQVKQFTFMLVRFFQLLLISFCLFSFSQVSFGGSILIPPVQSKYCPSKPCPSGYSGTIYGEFLDVQGNGNGGKCSYHKMDNCRIENGNGRLIPPAVVKYCPPKPCPSGYAGMIQGESLDIDGRGDGNVSNLTCSYHKTATCVKGMLGKPPTYPGQDNSCKCPPSPENHPNKTGICPTEKGMEWQTRTYPHYCNGNAIKISCSYKECRPKAQNKCNWVVRNLVPSTFDSGSLRVCDRNKGEGKDGAVCGKDDACISPEIMKGNPELLGLATRDTNAKVVKIFKCDCIGSCRLKFSGLVSLEGSYTKSLPICPSENSSTANATCSDSGKVCKKASPESFSAGELKDGWRKIYRCDCF